MPPQRDAPLGRRTLIHITAAAGMAGCARPRPETAPRLTAAELRLLELVCEQIIPSDKEPGAREAGAAQYIDQQLSGLLTGFPERYHRGLAALEASSRGVYSRDFEALTFGERTALLRLVAAGKIDQAHWRHEPSRAFFEMVRRHTIEGTFCPPRYGGNRNLVGYRLLGWEYPEPGGQNRYRDPRFVGARKDQ